MLPHYDDVTQDDETIAQLKKIFSERQISRLYVVGSNDTTASVIEDSYKRFLDCLNEHLKTYPFIMGHRPGSADFACFGQLTQLVQFDPTPADIAAAGFPRVHTPGSVRWRTYRVSRSRTTPSSTRTKMPSTLKVLFSEIGRTYVPVMLANSAALDQGTDKVEATVEGKPGCRSRSLIKVNASSGCGSSTHSLPRKIEAAWTRVLAWHRFVRRCSRNRNFLLRCARWSTVAPPDE